VTEELKDLDCEYEGCENDWIGWEPRFGYRYCEEHKNVPPAKWKHKDGYN
jgi:hypothetical protein